MKKSTLEELIDIQNKKYTAAGKKVLIDYMHDMGDFVPDGAAQSTIKFAFSDLNQSVQLHAVTEAVSTIHDKIKVLEDYSSFGTFNNLSVLFKSKTIESLEKDAEKSKGNKELFTSIIDSLRTEIELHHMPAADTVKALELIKKYKAF